MPKAKRSSLAPPPSYLQQVPQALPEQDVEIPFKVGFVTSRMIRSDESFRAPSGQAIVDPAIRPSCTSVQIKLSKQVFGKDKKLGFEERNYVLRLPCRTDVNDATRDKHRSEDVVRALILDPNYGQSFEMIELNEADRQDLGKQERNKEFRAELKARRDVLEKQPILAMNGLAATVPITAAAPTISIPA